MDERGPTPFADIIMLCAGEEISISDSLEFRMAFFFEKIKASSRILQELIFLVWFDLIIKKIIKLILRKIEIE